MVDITRLFLLSNEIETAVSKATFLQQLVLRGTTNIYAYSLLVCRVHNRIVTNADCTL